MTIYSNPHVCGTADPIHVWTDGTYTFIEIGTSPNMLTIDAAPLRKAVAALDAFEAAQSAPLTIIEEAAE